MVALDFIGFTTRVNGGSPALAISDRCTPNRCNGNCFCVGDSRSPDAIAGGVFDYFVSGA